MNANPTRFIIIVVLAIAGVLVLTNAFDGASTPRAASAGSSPSPAASSSPKPRKTKESKPKPTQSPEPTGTLDGVRIQVFNATSQTGLAAAVQDKLERREDPPPVAAGPAGNANENQTDTVLYYRDKSDQLNAEYAAKKYFDGAEVKPISQIPAVNVNGVTTEVSKDVQVAIVVGEDSAA